MKPTDAKMKQFLQCGRKVQFISKLEASNRAGQINAKGGQQLEPYRCPHCRGWHLRKMRIYNGK